MALGIAHPIGARTALSVQSGDLSAGGRTLLTGAAFTLRCTVRNLGGAGVLVIAPPGVKILPEQHGGRYEPVETYSAPAPDWSQEEYGGPRERRVSQNAFGWDNAARFDGPGLNPYTGSMPAAAGSYCAYGGYY